jgi:hypothetical protein
MNADTRRSGLKFKKIFKGEMASSMYLAGVTSAAEAGGFRSSLRRAPPQQAKIGLAGGP